MENQNEMAILMEDLVESWKETATENAEKSVLYKSLVKSYQKALKEKEEEIYELKLTIEELKQKES